MDLELPVEEVDPVRKPLLDVVDQLADVVLVDEPRDDEEASSRKRTYSSTVTLRAMNGTYGLTAPRVDGPRCRSFVPE